MLVLCFSQWFLLFLPPKFLLISCRPIDSYSDICYLGTDELIIFVSFLWMIWVNLPFLIYRSIYLQQNTIFSRAHLVLTNLLITSLLVLCFSRWFLLFLPPNILLISCHPRLLFWYLLFRYRWAHHLCFLSMNDLSRSSFFDLSIYLTNLLLTSLLVLGFSDDFFCFCLKNSFDFMSS